MKFFSKKRAIKADFRERDPHIQVIIVTADKVEPACLDAILNQDYPSYSVMISQLKPYHYDTNVDRNRIYNIVRNRNMARRMALATDHNSFFLLDSDVVVPKDGLSNLAMQNKDHVAGWYKMRSHPGTSDIYPTGLMLDGIVQYFPEPLPSLTIAHFTGLGCSLISRRLLEKVEFREGSKYETLTNLGTRVFTDDSAQFCYDAMKLGFITYLDGSVICEHLHRETKGIKTFEQAVVEAQMALQ